jgi:hypothetical protein
MNSDNCSGNPKTINFELSPEDLKAIASGRSVQIPSSKFFGKTTFTIDNAPIPKSANDKVTIQLHVEKNK